jgi:hypothetical protein
LLRDESLEESDNLPDPDVLGQEIVADLEAALEQFRQGGIEGTEFSGARRLEKSRNSACGGLRPLFACYLWSQFVEAATEVGDIVKRLLGDGLSNRLGLSTVSTKNDDPRVVVLHG